MVKGKKRCRMHGGAKGSGGQKHNKNALKHGLYTQEAIAEQCYMRELIKSSQQLMTLFGKEN